MNLALSMFHLNPPKFTTISCSQRQTQSASKTPARDRVISLGKYNGQMLGSLPSIYLRWVSKNLRSGDTEEWARLADEVLEDSVYRDRIEWEVAENVLSGNRMSSASSGKDSASALVEVSERFGWDNEDKIGWSKIDFKLLGTSRGGRIPRRRREEAEAGRRRRKRPPLKGGENEGVQINIANPFPGREALLNKVRKTYKR